MDKQIDISGRYAFELQEIKNKLSDLEQRRIYELSGAQMDGYLATNIQKLRKMLSSLIHKIEYSLPSIEEELDFDQLQSNKIRDKEEKDDGNN